MGELSQDSHSQWQELDYRPTHYGLDLILRRDAQQGQSEILVFDDEGATELILSDEKAIEAFTHPSVTPGLEPDKGNHSPWDAALDAYNGLSVDAQEKAMNKFTKYVESGAVAPTILLDAVKRISEQRLLNRAA